MVDGRKSSHIKEKFSNYRLYYSGDSVRNERFQIFKCNIKAVKIRFISYNGTYSIQLVV
jgi:hypothetical protein